MRPFAIGSLLVLSAVCFSQTLRAGEGAKDIIDCKITLAKGDVYMRGATDPVADLSVTMTLTNTSTAEKAGKDQVQVKEAKFLSLEDYKKLITTETKKKEDLDAVLKASVDASVTVKNVDAEPVNKASFGVAYVPPVLGPNDLVEFEVTKVAEGAQPEGAKPKLIQRNMLVDHTGRTDLSPTAYLAAGATSPEYVLPIGKFYLIREPGKYTAKAILRQLPDSRTPSGRVESNAVEFRVLPFKVVDQDLRSMTDFWADFERGHPDFEYMFYQLPLKAPYQEIYYVQRLKPRGVEKWEWHRLCTIVQGATAQVAQVNPMQVAILAPQAGGNAGLYVVDFTTVDPKVVKTQQIPIVDKKVPTLVVEGGNVEAK
jgi:hypothetical protein